MLDYFSVSSLAISICKIRVIRGLLFDQSDYFVKVVWGLDGRVAELALSFFVVVDGQIGVFEGMASQDAGDALVGVDEAFGPQVCQGGDRLPRGRVPARAPLSR